MSYPADQAVSYPADPATVQDGLAALGTSECLAQLDELMSRRPHNKTDLRWQIRLWRQERLAWNDARDKRATKKEESEE